MSCYRWYDSVDRSHWQSRCHCPPPSRPPPPSAYSTLSLLISAPSLGVYYCQQLTLSGCPDVCLFVCHTPSNCFFFFVSRWNRAIFGRQLSVCHSTTLFSAIFDLGPLTPKIYSQNLQLHKIAYNSACSADRPEMFGPTRGFSWMTDSMEPCKMLWGRPLLPRQRNLG